MSSHSTDNPISLHECLLHLENQLLRQRREDGTWEGELSSGAVSTATSIVALRCMDAGKYAPLIEKGYQWLEETMLPEGAWGDTPESRSNLTATLLSVAALHTGGRVPAAARASLEKTFGGLSDTAIIRGVLSYYGTDLTFSVPILLMCAITGLIGSCKEVPRFPFELALLPQSTFKLLRLPVVSYAIPALIAVGIVRHKEDKGRWFFSLREWATDPCLRVLEKLQPANGGFLEAPPLTAFVAMSLITSGYKTHPVTDKAINYLMRAQRSDGSWPIDINLSQWVTSLAIKALGTGKAQYSGLAQLIKQRQFKEVHPFTGAAPGGWGWTHLPGSVPDADDTPGALIALYNLEPGHYTPEIGAGIAWLLGIQNSDGGIPTFCRGWGKLPFDRSAPDLSAHTFRAFQLWLPSLPVPLAQRVTRSCQRITRWLQQQQTPEGFWLPLWFGSQETPNEENPVYGTAVVLDNLGNPSAMEPSLQKVVTPMRERGIAFLLSAQNPDGGWGPAAGYPSRTTLTAKALSALCAAPLITPEAPCTETTPTTNSTAHHTICHSAQRAAQYLCHRFSQPDPPADEPIGLYFSRLWYSEALYNLTFTVHALRVAGEQICPARMCLSVAGEQSLSKWFKELSR